MSARCVGDDNDEVTESSSTCPTSGAYSSFTYDATWPTLPRFERHRSSLTAALAESEYVYDSTLPVVRYVYDRGYTNDLAGVLVGPRDRDDRVPLRHGGPGHAAARAGRRAGR